MTAHSGLERIAGRAPVLGVDGCPNPRMRMTLAPGTMLGANEIVAPRRHTLLLENLGRSEIHSVSVEIENEAAERS